MLYKFIKKSHGIEYSDNYSNKRDSNNDVTFADISFFLHFRGKTVIKQCLA